jgi:hypothetical protein
MKATAKNLREFQDLHEKYIKANERIVMLQQKAIQGMKIIGVGCVNEESKAEFLRLKIEIAQILTRMKEICDSMT